MGTASSAVCALHPLEPASGVCARCGNFVCGACTEGGTQVMCPRCRAFAAVGFPLTRANFEFSRVWDHAWAAFTREWAMLSLAALILLMFGAASSLISTIMNRGILFVLGLKTDPANPFTKAFFVEFGLNATLGTLINLLIQSVALFGFMRVLMDALIGRKVDLARMFSLLPRLPSFLALQLLVFALVQLPLYLVIGGIGGLVSRQVDFNSPETLLSFSVFAAVAAIAVLVFVYSVITLPITFFAGPELLVGNCSPFEAIRRAWAMADGLRVGLLGYSIVFVAVLLAGFVLCCVGFIPALALGYALVLTLFLAARDPSFGPAAFE
jgi:hypothetical protein